MNRGRREEIFLQKGFLSPPPVFVFSITSYSYDHIFFG